MIVNFLVNIPANNVFILSDSVMVAFIAVFVYVFYLCLPGQIAMWTQLYETYVLSTPAAQLADTVDAAINT